MIFYCHRILVNVGNGRSNRNYRFCSVNYTISCKLYPAGLLDRLHFIEFVVTFRDEFPYKREFNWNVWPCSRVNLVIDDFHVYNMNCFELIIDATLYGDVHYICKIGKRMPLGHPHKNCIVLSNVSANFTKQCRNTGPIIINRLCKIVTNLNLLQNFANLALTSAS